MHKLLAFVAVSLFVPATAQAVPVEVNDGEARFTYGSGGTVASIRSGRLNGRNGRLALVDGLRLGFGKDRVAFSAVEILFGPRGFVRGTTKGGQRRRFYAVDTSRAKVPDTGLAVSLYGVRLRPIGPLKGRSALRATLEIDAAPKFLRVAGGQSELRLDQAFRDALAAEQIQPGGGEGSPLTDDGAITFPVSRGRLASKGLEGMIEQGGGITFSKGAVPAVRLEDYLVDTRADTIAGRVNDGEREALFTTTLPAATIDGDVVSFADAAVALTQRAADVLNSAFATSAFFAGQALGTLTVRAEVE